MRLKRFSLEISVCLLGSVVIGLPLTELSTDDWNREANPMTKNSFGVWELTLPAKDGVPAIPHNTKVKAGFKHVSMWVALTVW
jgi:hypothetical protein